MSQSHHLDFRSQAARKCTEQLQIQSNRTPDPTPVFFVGYGMHASNSWLSESNVTKLQPQQEPFFMGLRCSFDRRGRGFYVGLGV